MNEKTASVLKLQKQQISPFLKWAGGKRWFVEKHSRFLNVEYERFIEPFVGSGAVFFKLLPERAILCDKNAKLVEVYKVLQKDWKNLKKLLEKHQERHSIEYYYKIRSEIMKTPAERAAKFIYLNRTCWNGLYRVNKSGEFNVPIGTKNTVLLPSDNFEHLSMYLKNVELIAGDFELALKDAGAGDFVFIDPPYTVKHNNNGFTKYNEHIFSWDDQIRLRNMVEVIVSRGAKVIVTNACHDSIKKIYRDIGEIITVNRASVIAGKASARGLYEEVIIKCF